MSYLVKNGQRVELEPSLNTLILSFDFGNIELNSAVLLCSPDQKVKNEHDFIFHGNTNSSGVTILSPNSIKISLKELREDITDLSFILYLDDNSATMPKNQLLKVKDGSGVEIICFKHGLEYQTERAVVVARIYKKNNRWKFSAIGSGYNGGLKAICELYGLDFKEYFQKNRAKKLILTNSTPIVLTNQATLLRNIKLNLTWNQKRQTNTILSNILNSFKASDTDLDLGCFVETIDGRLWCIQALGGYLGNFDRAPYVYLNGDDKDGFGADGENIYINGNYLSKIRRILVYSFIYTGATNWSKTDARITITCSNQPQIEAKQDNLAPPKPLCALVLFENSNGQFIAKKIMKFYDDQKALDLSFKWGFDWKIKNR